MVFSAFFLIHSIYCFLSLIQRLQKLKFVEALIENWFSRELSQVLNSITIFQLTPTWAFIDIICFKNWTLHLSNNSFIEKLFSVPSKEEIQTFSLLVRKGYISLTLRKISTILNNDWLLFDSLSLPLSLCTLWIFSHSGIFWWTEGTVLVWWIPQNKSKSLEEQTSLVRLLYPWGFIFNF